MAFFLSLKSTIVLYDEDKKKELAQHTQLLDQFFFECISLDDFVYFL